MGKLRRPEVGAHRRPLPRRGRGPAGLVAGPAIHGRDPDRAPRRPPPPFRAAGRIARRACASRDGCSRSIPLKGACPACRGLGVEDRIDPVLLVADPARTLRQGALSLTTPTGYIIYSQVTMEVLDEVCRAHGFSADIPWRDLTDAQRDVVLNGSERILIRYGKHPLESRLRWKGIVAKPREEGVLQRHPAGDGDDPGDEAERQYPAVRPDAPLPGLRRARGSGPSRCRVTVGGPVDRRPQRPERPRLGRGIPKPGIRRRRPRPPARPCAPRSSKKRTCSSGSASATCASTGPPTRSPAARSSASGWPPRPAAACGASSTSSTSRRPGSTRRTRPACSRSSASSATTATPSSSSSTTRTSCGRPTISSTSVPARATRAAASSIRARRRGSSELERGLSPTRDFLAGDRVPAARPRGRPGAGRILVRGARLHNLKDVDVEFRLGALNVVTGVSGAGKSTPGPPRPGRAPPGRPARPGPDAEGLTIEGTAGRVVEVDQSPIGRTPRSNPATYTKISDRIRDLFAALPESRREGFGKGRFSFNVAGGRCETCQGAGLLQIGMHFLGDVDVVCPDCDGRRFNDETLAVKDRGKNIHDVLEMSVAEAAVVLRRRAAARGRPRGPGAPRASATSGSARARRRSRAARPSGSSWPPR
ncbi:MAG: hypothetical protein MZU91_11210 [Desulfosudis oleivorans]|nr:hypothetical protein [Desulfosudis oleivorans]